MLILTPLQYTTWLDGAIDAPGVDGGEVLRPMPESPQNLPQIHPKFAPWCGPSSTGARCSANIKYSMEVHSKVRWDGKFDRLLTQSVARDMADGWSGSRGFQPLFLCHGQEGGGRARGSHQHGRGKIMYGM